MISNRKAKMPIINHKEPCSKPKGNEPPLYEAWTFKAGKIPYVRKDGNLNGLTL
jgi:hypothetical protein